MSLNSRFKLWSKSLSMSSERYLRLLRESPAAHTPGIYITEIDKARLKNLVEVEQGLTVFELEHEIERAIVVAALDSAISDAGDNGDDELYQALQALKAAAVADINARGAAVPELRIVSTPASLPSLVLAHRLYGDIGREAELVSRARPRHPAFMPTSFKALSE